MESVVSGLRWTILSRVVYQLITWATTFLVIRLLTPADYGLVAMAALVAAFFALLSELGLSAILIQRRTEDVETLRSVFGALLVAGVALYGATVATAPLIALYFQEPAVTKLISLVAVQFLVMPFAVIPQAKLSIQLRFKALGFVGIVTALFGAASTLSLAFLGYGPYSLVGGTLVGAVARAVTLNGLAPFLRLPTLRWHNIRDFVGFSGYVLTERSIWYWYRQADALIIGAVLGVGPLGIFSVAKQVASIPLERFAEIMNMIALPVFSAVKDDANRVRQGFLKAIRIGAVLSFPTFLGLAVVAEDLLLLLIGDKWESTIPIVQLLCVSMPIRLVANMSSPVLLAIGRPDASLRCLLWAAICVPLAMLYGVQWGLQGVAAAWAAVYPIAFLGGMWHVSRALNIRMRTLLSPLIAPLGASLAMVVTVLVTVELLGADQGRPIRLVLGVSTGVIAYTAVLWIISRSRFEETWMLIRSIIVRRQRVQHSLSQP